MKLSLKAIQDWQEGAEERLQSLEIRADEQHNRLCVFEADLGQLIQRVSNVVMDMESRFAEFEDDDDDDDEDLLS